MAKGRLFFFFFHIANSFVLRTGKFTFFLVIPLVSTKTNFYCISCLNLVAIYSFCYGLVLTSVISIFPNWEENFSRSSLNLSSVLQRRSHILPWPHPFLWQH